MSNADKGPITKCFLCKESCTMEQGIVRFFCRVHPKCWDIARSNPEGKKIIEEMKEQCKRM